MTFIDQPDPPPAPWPTSMTIRRDQLTLTLTFETEADLLAFYDGLVAMEDQKCRTP